MQHKLYNDTSTLLLMNISWMLEQVKVYEKKENQETKWVLSNVKWKYGKVLYQSKDG